MDISNLSLDESKALLKDLNLLKKMKKDLGNRGQNEFERIKENKSTYNVEFFPALWLEEAQSQALKMFDKAFGLSLNLDEIKFVENSNLKWGLRIFVDDKMCDLTFSDAERKIA